ncbi:MAG: hypothetical protein PHY47_00150 [Lachnospiraceae bacterium]|nr:hypothetical protein [Lachnospiraceae bacterium]
MRREIAFKISAEMLRELLFEDRTVDIIDVEFDRSRHIFKFYIYSDNFEPLHEGDETPEYGAHTIKLKGRL